MMSCQADLGYLCFYLTRHEIWGEENWEEYPLPLESRYKIFEFKKDEELHDLILKKVEDAEPKKQQMIEMLNGALVMDFEQFFFTQMDGFKLRELKSASNILNVEQVIRCGDKFYYEMK